MIVKLVNYTQNNKDMTLFDQVAYCARVSNPSNQDNKDNKKLIRYLIKNKHWSPFEMVNVCLEIQTTRDIAKQILRHRSFSFQEFSQRYAQPKELGAMFSVRECRLQDKVNRQNSIKTDNKALTKQWTDKQQEIIDKSKEVYEWAIKNGIAKEQARAVLPEGCTNTKLYMNGTLRSWMHYILLRRGNGTQLEHAEIAQTCEVVLGVLLKDKNWLTLPSGD